MPNWVFLAVPLAILCVVYVIYSAVQDHREQAYLHAVYDGDRIEQWRNDKRNAKRKPTARHERHFY